KAFLKKRRITVLWRSPEMKIVLRGCTAALATCAVALLASPRATAQTVFSVVPSTSTAALGSTFVLDVNVSGATDLYGYQFDLAFNPAVLSAMSPTEGSFLSNAGATFFIPGTADNVGGTVPGTADTLLSNVSGVNGHGTLASFDFTAAGTGTSPVTIDNVIALNSGLNNIDVSTVG